MKNNKKSISRKEFLVKLSWISMLPYLLLAGFAFRQNARINHAKNIRIPMQINNGVTFRDGLIIVKNETSIEFITAKCTHLGCNIHSMENNELVCPCHGSRFSLTGACLKGPAKEPLRNLEYEIDEIANEYIIKI